MAIECNLRFLVPDEACTDGQLQCRNGVCVDISSRCNSINDCGADDNTDEQGCGKQIYYTYIVCRAFIP